MHPILLRGGPVQVHSYGVLLMLAFIAGILVSRRQARRLGLHPDLPVDMGVWILAASIVLARLLFVLLEWPDYAERPAAIWQVWREGGLSYFGGLLGGVLAVLVYAWRTGHSFWTLAGLLSPGLALGYGIARIGCFLNGCCYGAPTSLPWGVRFPLYADSDLTTSPSHPAQLYAALGSLLIFAALLWLCPRVRHVGQVFAAYAMLYATLRTGVEVLREGSTARALFGHVTQAQVASLPLFAAGLAALIWLGRREADRDGRAARGE